MLPAVRTGFNHSNTSCLRDGLMLMLTGACPRCALTCFSAGG